MYEYSLCVSMAKLALNGVVFKQLQNNIITQTNPVK